MPPLHRPGLVDQVEIRATHEGVSMHNFWADVVKPILRPYQIDVRDRTRNTAAILKRLNKPVRVILQCATGGGKSVIALDLILHAYDLKKRVLFIVSGRALVNQFET